LDEIAFLWVKSLLSGRMMDRSPKALISARHKAGSKPDNRDNACRLALVIEGGGMRAVTVGGMVSGLEVLGLRDVFDFVCGSSAGAVAGAYFLARQARFGTAMFYENLNNSGFIDTHRLWKRKPVMDTSFLIDKVMRFDKRLDVAAVIAGTPHLHVVASDIVTGQPAVRSVFESAEEFFQFLRATVTMPLIGGPPVPFNGSLLYDGGLVQQIAVETAIKQGATHILVLLTRRRSDCYPRAATWRERTEAKLLDALYGKRVGDLYRCRRDTIERSLDLCFSEAKQHENNVRIETIVLPEALNYISRLTLDGELLRRGERDAFTAVLDFGLTSPNETMGHVKGQCGSH
jgi:predicted patatin/cPLA2 family phospholipase